MSLARRAPEGAAESASAHSAGPYFYVCGRVGLWLWVCGVVGLWFTNPKRNKIQVLLINDAQIDTQDCEIHSKTIQNLKDSKQIDQIVCLASLGAGSVLGRQDGAKWTSMDQHGAKEHQKEANACQNGARGCKHLC